MRCGRRLARNWSPAFGLTLFNSRETFFDPLENLVATHRFGDARESRECIKALPVRRGRRPSLIRIT